MQVRNISELFFIYSAFRKIFYLAVYTINVDFF